MKHFYEQVYIDTEHLRFAVQCPICGSKWHGTKIPIGCRNVKTLARCTKGTANRYSQTRYTHAKAASVLQLSLHFNRCRCCLRWVCDQCYDLDDGTCRECAKKC